jgi:integrase
VAVLPELAVTPTRKDEARLYKAARRVMARVLKAAGLPAHFTPHSLRRLFGSLLIAAGESPAYVQQQMGHASIHMTVDVYGSWLPVRAAGAVDRLAAATSPDGDRMVTSEAPEARSAASEQSA